MDLTERVLDLCSYLTVSGEEGPLTDALQQRYRDEQIIRLGDSLVVGAPDGRPLVLLVGHLDVVPPTLESDRKPRLEERDGAAVIVGRGTSDMKSGVAVAQALFEDAELRATSPYCLVAVFYAREEVAAEDNELGPVLEQVAWLREAQLAIVLEGTDLEVQVGCLGGIHAELTVEGSAAHSARPWQGDNAVTKAWPLLRELGEIAPREVVVEGVTYRDVVTVTQAWTRNVRNVVPGRFTINVNYRFAPDRTMEQAEAELAAMVGDRARIEIVDRALPAAPQLNEPLVRAMVDAIGAPVTAKQAWTDVARLIDVGVPALNYGPGVTAQAHQAGEYVTVANLERAHEVLRAFLSGGVTPSS